MPRSPRHFPAFRFFISCAALFISANARAQDAMPRNFGRGLQDLVAWRLENPGLAPDRMARLLVDRPRTSRSRMDNNVTSAVVDVRLDGSVPLATVRANLEALGLTIIAKHEARGAGSVLSAHLPLEQALTAAKMPGVFSIVLVHRPYRRVGKVTSQGAGVLHSGTVNALGYTGTGITIGILSDSFDVAAPHAQADVLSGDLPGPGNPFGRTQPVYLLEEGSPQFGIDEGRAMAQIIHDVAPGAALAFASSGMTQSAFAENIRALRTDSHTLCDILVDDIVFPDEPFFSDGIVAQAVDDVANSTALAGKKVLYYSAAGNDGGLGYVADFNPVSNATARSGLRGSNLKLQQVPRFVTAGGFHNFASSGTPVISQRVKVSHGPAEIAFQWDDSFLPGGITSDYDLLVFDASGNYLRRFSGIDDNFGTGEPLEIIDLFPAVYQLAITRTSEGSHAATHLRYVVNTDGNYTSTFMPPNLPTIFGHAGAPNADAVAAYSYETPDRPEPFTSLGPLTIYFDGNGQRLATPEVRAQPTMAAPDGADTTFFGDDSDENGFPNFFGTSAAAPHAAGVAALLLQAAGGPGSYTAAQMRSLLQNSARMHDLDPAFSKAVIATSDNLSTATLTATGDDSDNSSGDKHFFSLSFTGPATRRLASITIDLAPAGLNFDPRLRKGFPLHLSNTAGLNGSRVKYDFRGRPKTELTLFFTSSSLANGATVDFGIDRDKTEFKAGGNSADFLQGAAVTIRTVDQGAEIEGQSTFGNIIGDGFTPVDGFGLIDAAAALDLLLP